jgi:hypothetical protein
MYINKITSRRRIPALTLLLAAAFVIFTGVAGRASADVPVVLPLDKPHFGKTYGEWAATWWQWALKYPVKNNPLFDETGKRAQIGNQGQMFFLGGVFNASGTVTRTIKVPAKIALFFPVLNYEADNFFNNPPIDPPLDIAGLRQLAASFMDPAIDLFVELDGNSIPNVNSYRFQSPVFGVHMPQNNVYQEFGYSAPPGEYAPMVDDGYYIMLAPLSAGPHILHFTGTLPQYPFTVDITYNITVAPGG